MTSTAPGRAPSQPDHAGRKLLAIALAYSAFVAYGSLLPFAFRARSLDAALAAFARIPYLELGVAERADWVANALLYIPLAFFAAGAAGSLRGRAARLTGTVLAVLACLALAFAIEFAQLFFLPRTVSQNDLIAESIGTGLGVALWLVAGRRVLDLARQLTAAGPRAVGAALVLYAIAYLALSFFPYDFLVSGAELAAKLNDPGRPAWVLAQPCGNAFRCGATLLAEVLLVAPFGILYGVHRGPLGRASYLGALLWGLALGALVEGVRLFLASGVSEGLSLLTSSLGVAWGFAVYRSIDPEWLLTHRRVWRRIAWLAAPAYVAALLALKGLLPLALEETWVAAERLRELSFLPFLYHYATTETEAMRSLLLTAGLYAPVGLLAWISTPPGRRSATPWVAALAGGLLALGVEALGLFTAGRRSDPTNVLIAAATSYLVTLGAQWLEQGFIAGSQPNRAPHAGEPPRARMLGLGVSMAAIAVLVFSGALGLATPYREQRVDESELHKLPSGHDLPPAQLAGFRFAHPRLPHPSPLDIEVLRQRNPDFLAQQRRAANGGRGEFDAVILMEFVEPGSQDLDALVGRLLALKYSWRGHGPTMPVVLAYDWLYGRLNAAQQAALRDKVAEGCNYLVERIRTERLSPYNVILYNAPFQALVACAIALYRDDVRGEPVMRFTYDLWKNRVLPVWRQIMGQNGGWHEGGEYVGIGIGQAIYRVPAMWRHATGEDLFASEPGIRGFLDFLVYRTQPDGSHFRWGDGAYFDRQVPDGLALALEFRHAAAYSLRRPPRQPVPSAWPWGPLTDDTLYDPEAVKGLPLARHFDGIGLVVARSDWTPYATYVTFKAGDNYWSHVHLDQGAFTISKGGPLAIDSGLYGPRYGSDHHMNYSYQTIAHNTITVTDPEDGVPAPGREKPRPIANDGGQRRVGSGWGVEAAPLDLAEWNAKRDLYHTGRIERLIDQDGITVAVADLTPAYTNALSGKGTFSHRTRRVERFRRVIGYDRVDDVVVVFDDVEASDAAFGKRWLLHTVERPEIGHATFAVAVPRGEGRGRAGGQLVGHVLFPERHALNAVGGRGFEFFVGERNYDEDGKVLAIARQRGPLGPEPGAWRIELTPEHAAKEDQFLVVLLPARLTQRPVHAVRPLRDATSIGCEIAGPSRTTIWRFNRALGLADLRVGRP
jgi:VanZ family protein